LSKPHARRNIQTKETLFTKRFKNTPRVNNVKETIDAEPGQTNDAAARAMDRSFLFILLALFATAVALVMFAYASSFQIAWMYEWSSYADAARHVASGQGLRTDFVNPMELAYLEREHLAQAPFPFTHRFPLFALLLAAAFRVFGAQDVVEASVIAVLFGALVVTVAYAGRRLFPQSRAVAIAAAAIILVNPMFWRWFALWGYGSDILFATLLTLHAISLAENLEDTTSAPWRWYGIGLGGGVCYLARYNYTLFVPVVVAVIILFSANHRVRRLALFLAGFATVFVSWFLYRQLAVGSVQSVDLTSNVADLGRGLPWLDYTTINLAAFVTQNSRELLAKWIQMFFGHLQWLPTAFDNYLLMPFAIVACFFLKRTGAVERRRAAFAAFFLFGLLVQVVVFSFLRREPFGRYFLWLVPFAALMGVDFFFASTASLALRWRQVVRLGFALLFLGWTANTIVSINGLAYVKEWAEQTPRDVEFPVLDAKVPRDAWIVSNVGVHLGWYLNHPAIDLPNTPDDLMFLLRHYPVKAIYIAGWPQGETKNRPYWAWYVSQPEWDSRFAKATGFGTVIHIRNSVLFLPGTPPP
jgi:4-amino-4-deoxy-L-arabinose transferase-like glycosyltransferase